VTSGDSRLSGVMRYWELATPIGSHRLAADEQGLRSISFPSSRHAVKPLAGWRRSEEPFRGAIEQLGAYFAGRRSTFDLTLAPAGTPFQLRVWELLRTIPYGETVSYGELARRLGTPTGARAVGAANGRNPIPIIIPCHRVVGSDGSLTGFGGGISIKRQLLDLEAAHRNGTGGEIWTRPSLPLFS